MAEKDLSPLDRLDLVEVERAAVDLRRGLPIVVSGGARAIFALTPETASPATLQTVRRWGTKDAIPLAALTHERAATLKIRLYTKGVVAIPLDWGPLEGGPLDEDPLLRARVLADPSEDMTHPLGGPYAALRSLEKRPLASAVKIAKIAGLLPTVLAIDFDTKTGEAAQSFATKHRLSYVSADAVAGYDLGITDTLSLVTRARVPLTDAEEAELVVFRSDAGGPEHYAVILGDLDLAKPVLTRIHSECFTGDLLASLKCDCGDQLRGAIREISDAGAGVLLYLAQEGRGIGLPNKMRAYRLQAEGYDTVEANIRLGFEVDERFFHPAARMLELLGIARVRLMTNNPLKMEALKALGVEVSERVAHTFQANAHNEHYLLTKKTKTGHLL